MEGATFIRTFRGERGLRANNIRQKEAMWLSLMVVDTVLQIEPSCFLLISG